MDKNEHKEDTLSVYFNEKIHQIPLAGNKKMIDALKEQVPGFAEHHMNFPNMPMYVAGQQREEGTLKDSRDLINTTRKYAKSTWLPTFYYKDLNVNDVNCDTLKIKIIDDFTDWYSVDDYEMWRGFTLIIEKTKSINFEQIICCLINTLNQGNRFSFELIDGTKLEVVNEVTYDFLTFSLVVMKTPKKGRRRRTVKWSLLISVSDKEDWSKLKVMMVHGDDELF